MPEFLAETHTPWRHRRVVLAGQHTLAHAITGNLRVATGPHSGEQHPLRLHYGRK